MKKFIVVFLILMPFILLSQQELNMSAKANKKIRTVQGKEISEGQVFKVIGFNGKSNEYAQYAIEVDGEMHSLFGDDVKRFTYVLSDNASLNEFWNVQMINEGVYDDLTKNGLQLDLRAEIEADALDFMAFAESNNSFFNDSYLESYIYSLVYRLFPGDLPDGRPGVLNVKVLIDIAPNAFMFPNGTLILTTGMLSTINSEEELMAVLAHEISHFVLDHSVDNINTAISRQKRAEFWAGVATVAAASAEIYAGTQGA